MCYQQHRLARQTFRDFLHLKKIEGVKEEIIKKYSIFCATPDVKNDYQIQMQRKKYTSYNKHYYQLFKVPELRSLLFLQTTKS